MLNYEEKIEDFIKFKMIVFLLIKKKQKTQFSGMYQKQYVSSYLAF